MPAKIKINRGAIFANAAFVFGYGIILHWGELLLGLCDAFFIAGMVNILLGLCCHVRNGGLMKYFLYFSYTKYRKGLRADIDKGILPTSTKVADFTEYCTQRYENKWVSAPFYICGAPQILLSVLLGQFITLAG